MGGRDGEGLVLGLGIVGVLGWRRGLGLRDGGWGSRGWG